MSGVDVSQLSVETLDRTDFPAPRRSDFRVSFTPAARDKMHAHAGADVSVEICGVLVGRLCQDDEGPFAIVEDCVCCESAASKFAEVTFTHESWAQINEEMDTKFAGKQIVGWYHSHPNFGVFLSDRDCFIHEHFFSGPGQVAYVIDPVRQEEGVFIWRDGTTAALPHYWVGDAIQASVLHDDSRPRHATSPSEQDSPRDDARGSRNTPEPWYAAMLPMLLTTLVAFLLGTTYARFTASWERQSIVEGVVAHYGVNKVVKIGLQEDLEVVSDRLRELANAVRTSADTPSGDEAPSPKAVAQRRRMIETGFRDTITAIRQIGERFGYDEFERRALLKYVAEKQAALRSFETARAEANKDAAKPAKAPASNAGPPQNDSTSDPPPPASTEAVREEPTPREATQAEPVAADRPVDTPTKP